MIFGFVGYHSQSVPNTLIYSVNDGGQIFRNYHMLLDLLTLHFKLDEYASMIQIILEKS